MTPDSQTIISVNPQRRQSALTEALRHAGYRVVEAATQEEALRLADTEGPALVLLAENDTDRFRVLADGAPALMWMNGPDGCEFVNQAYLDFLGVTDVDVRGYDWAQFVHPDDRKAYVTTYLEAVVERRLFEATFRFRRHDGEYRWMKSVGTPRFTEGGTFVGYVGSTMDITDLLEEGQRTSCTATRPQPHLPPAEALRPFAMRAGSISRPVAATHSDSIHRYRQASLRLAFATSGIAALALTGWAFGLPLLTNWSPDLASMKITTAVAFLCSAASVLVLNSHKSWSEGLLGRVVASGRYTSASVAGLIGLGTLVGYALGVPHAVSDAAWMAPATAMGFVLLAVALGTVGSTSWERVADGSALAVLCIGLLALLGYLYNEQSLYAVRPYVSMALPTALSFVLLGAALFCSHPDRGVMATITAEEPGGLMIRRLLPPLFGMLVAISWLRLAGEQTGWFDRYFGMAALVGLSLVGFSAALWSVSRSLNQTAVTLRDSEERLRLAQHVARVGTFEWNIRTGVNTWTAELEALYGLAPGQFARSQPAWEDLVHPDDRAQVVHLVEEAMQTGAPTQGEWRVIWPDGSLHWLAGRWQVFKDEMGRPIRMTGVNLDITDRKLGEEALRQSREDLDRAQEVGQIGWWRLDTRQNVLTWSDENHRIFGVPKGTPLSYEAFLDFVHPADRQELDRQWMAGLKGEPYDIEHRIVVDGQVKWVREKAYLEFDQGGALLGGFGITQDITGRKQMELALRDNEERLRLAQGIAQSGIFDWNVQTNEVTWTPELESVYGLVPGGFGRTYQDFRDRVHPDDVERIERERDRALVERRPFRHLEFRIIQPSGETRWVDSAGAGFYDDSGCLVRVLGINMDITERKRAEEALWQAQEQLQRWNVELEQAVNAKTTELLHSQERLRALATELNLAEQRERQHMATELHDHLQQMLVLGKLTLGQGKRVAVGIPACEQVFSKIDEILTEALTYTRTLVSELSPPVLRDHGLGAGLKWLGEYMKKHEVTVTVTVPTEEVTLPDDQVVLLFQSVRELLMNSWKHAGTGKAVIAMAHQDGQLQITVSDHGAGFDLAAAAAAAADSPNGGISSKFGLFSIRERMRALGGTFDIVSVPGQGTTATLVLPLGAAEPAARARSQGHGASGMQSAVSDQHSVKLPLAHGLSPLTTRHSPRSPIRVLLVDDHLMVRQGLRFVLDTYPDIELIGEACDGAEAVQMVAQLKPAVVVMDVNMPKLNGIEATAQIKTGFPDTAVIGLSVNVDGDNQTAMLKAGAAMLLTKEAAVEQLYHAIHDALNKQVTREA